jgi:hypothetical protein
MVPAVRRRDAARWPCTWQSQRCTGTGATRKDPMFDQTSLDGLLDAGSFKSGHTHSVDGDQR